MELFNIGILEFVFILLLALIVLGPQKAVKIAGDIGRWVRDFLNSPFWQDIVNTSKDLRDIPKKIMEDVEIQRTLYEIDHAIGNRKGTDNRRYIDSQEEISNNAEASQNNHQGDQFHSGLDT